MDINQWLDKQIDEGRWHPDFKRIFKMIAKEYQEYQDKKIKIDDEYQDYQAYSQRLKDYQRDKQQWPCPECGAKARMHKKNCSKFTRNPRVKTQ